MHISVVIATFNRAELLRATLEGLRHQPYEPGDEVIVVDNGSTDATPAVIARAADGFPVRFLARRELRPGKTPALNSGITVASGEILALTDDDVIVAGDWISTIREIFQDPSIDLVGGRVEPWWERPAPSWLRVEEHGRYGRLASPLALLHYGEPQNLGERTAVGANLAVRRSVFAELRGFAPHLGRRAGTLLCGEDHDFCQRAGAGGYRCVYRPQLRVRHWVPAERMRLSYYFRWFFWSGVTNAILERDAGTAGPGSTTRLIPMYLVRRLLVAPVAAFACTLAGRPADALPAAMDAAFAFGFIRQRICDYLRRQSMQPAAREQAGAALR